MGSVLEQGARLEVEVLIKKMIGDAPVNPGSDAFEDYMHTKSLLLEAWGGRMLMSPDDLLFRCAGCYKVRTNRGLNGGPCKCGAMKVTNHVGTLQTEELEKIVRSGY